MVEGGSVEPQSKHISKMTDEKWHRFLDERPWWQPATYERIYAFFQSDFDRVWTKEAEYATLYLQIRYFMGVSSSTLLILFGFEGVHDTPPYAELARGMDIDASWTHNWVKRNLLVDIIYIYQTVLACRAYHERVPDDTSQLAMEFCRQVGFTLRHVTHAQAIERRIRYARDAIDLMPLALRRAIYAFALTFGPRSYVYDWRWINIYHWRGDHTGLVCRVAHQEWDGKRVAETDLLRTLAHGIRTHDGRALSLGDDVARLIGRFVSSHTGVTPKRVTVQVLQLPPSPRTKILHPRSDDVDEHISKRRKA